MKRLSNPLSPIQCDLVEKQLPSILSQVNLPSQHYPRQLFQHSLNIYKIVCSIRLGLQRVFYHEHSNASIVDYFHLTTLFVQAFLREHTTTFIIYKVCKILLLKKSPSCSTYIQWNISHNKEWIWVSSSKVDEPTVSYTQWNKSEGETTSIWY